MGMGFHSKKDYTVDTEEGRIELAQVYTVLFEECVKKIDFKKIIKVKKCLAKKDDNKASYNEGTLLSTLEYLYSKGMNLFLSAEKLEDTTVSCDSFSITIRKEPEIEILYVLEEVYAVLTN